MSGRKKNKKILILGSTGMFGHVMCQVIEKLDLYDLFNISYRKKLNDQTILCDVTKIDKLEKISKEIQPNIIINCIGVLKKGAQADPGNAIYLNSCLPHFLSSMCDRIDAKLIHITTDCVFSGKKGAYLETDFKDADDIYGRSKALGEINNDRDLTIRTSYIGPELKKDGEGLLHWFLSQEAVINGYTKMMWGGVTTLELAKGIIDAIEKDLTGLIHFTNKIPISKYDLLNLLKSVFDSHVGITSTEGIRIDRSLSSSRNDWDYKIPSYESMLNDMKLQMDSNFDLYSDIYRFQN